MRFLYRIGNFTELVQTERSVHTVGLFRHACTPRGFVLYAAAAAIQLPWDAPPPTVKKPNRLNALVTIYAPLATDSVFCRIISYGLQWQNQMSSTTDSVILLYTVGSRFMWTCIYKMYCHYSERRKNWFGKTTDSVSCEPSLTFLGTVMLPIVKEARWPPDSVSKRYPVPSRESNAGSPSTIQAHFDFSCAEW
jgi:hypothetical protein